MPFPFFRGTRPAFARRCIGLLGGALCTGPSLLFLSTVRYLHQLMFSGIRLPITGGRRHDALHACVRAQTTRRASVLSCRNDCEIWVQHLMMEMFFRGATTG